MKKFGLFLVLSGMLCSQHLFAQSSTSSPKFEYITNEAAPTFTLKDVDGKAVSLTDYKGKVVVLDFWATWCEPCKASFPGMQQAVNRYKDDLDVVFLFIDTREKVKDYQQLVSSFLKENQYSFKVLYDEMGFTTTNSKLYNDYKIAGIPTKFIIDRNGIVRFEKIGFMPDNSDLELANEVSDMIEKAKKPASNSTSIKSK